MAQRPVIVLGAGGHAKVVIDLLRKLGRAVPYAAEQMLPSLPRVALGVPVEDENALLKISPADVDLALGIGMPANEPVAGLGNRRAVARRFEALGYRFPALVHPSAIIAEGCEIGAGAQIMAGAVLQASAVVGGFAIVNTGSTIDHDCILGEGCHVAPGAILGGGVRVGAETLVGIGAVVRQGLSIGARVLIAGGAMVVDNVADGQTRVGVPARGLS